MHANGATTSTLRGFSCACQLSFTVYYFERLVQSFSYLIEVFREPMATRAVEDIVSFPDPPKRKGGSGEYSTQWRSQSAANARAQHGHTTLASSLVRRPRPAFSRLQYGNAEATRRVWGVLPHKILEFLSFLV